MGLGERLLGYVSAPFVGDRNDGSRFTDSYYSAADDPFSERDGPSVNFGPPNPQRIVPWDINIRVAEGGNIRDREQGTWNLVPGRVLSAQTKLKNTLYELPADAWTQNPEGPAYIVRVPGLPNQVINLPTVTNFTTQPEYLQPIVNLQIQNELNWIDQFRATIFGQATQQAQMQSAQDSASMFPSIFGGSLSISSDINAGAE